MKKLFVLGFILIIATAFTAGVSLFENERPVFIPPSPQRLGGDAKKGFDYLVTGDYVKGGIPLNFFLLGMGKTKTNWLEREGINSKISHEFTAITASNGEVLVAPNCMQCHAQVFEDSLYVGMGNSFMDFTKFSGANMQLLEKILKTTAPKKYEAAETFITVGKAIGPYLATEVRGVNAADKLAGVLAAHRDPVTLKWNNTPQLPIPKEVIPTDVPAWWLLKKKNAMFYNGFGRGDFGKFLMASNLLTVNDTSESRQVDEHMPDLLAYIYSIEPPKYPHPIDSGLAASGKILFESACSHCHGTYGDDESFPNLLIPQSIIQTDSLLSTSNYSTPQFVNWFNNSWFTTGDHPAKLEPFKGYIAPPLDGIWVTAPYLHNGSVPTLEAILDSKLRPQFWERNFMTPQYDYQRVGWTYNNKDKAGSSNIYNTTLPGYGNRGHNFADRLTEAEKKAVLEYLKTL
jgi:mono/diheme cytochrome c family protein